MMKTIRGTELQLEYLTTHEQFLKLKEFAESFDHNVSMEDMKDHMVAIKKGDQWIGYFQLFTSPVFFTAWHPEHSTPRDVVEGMKMISGWTKIESTLRGKLPALTTVALDTKTFTQKILEKLGLRRLKLELYTLGE